MKKIYHSYFAGLKMISSNIFNQIKTSVSILMIIFISFYFTAQTKAQDLPVIRTVQKAYAKSTRNQTGVSGKSYWQNKADYTIKVNFNPASRELKGEVLIDYTNNSPDTLKSLVLKLYPNFYKSNSMRNMPVSVSDLSDGVSIEKLNIDGKEVGRTSQHVGGTNMFVPGIKILPGRKAQLKINYHYTLNKGSFIRTGEVDSSSFFIAYFFPRVAVYDDIDGWNEFPYVGKEEFYNDYGNFHVEITVPGDYAVWATGDLLNCKDVYQPKICERIHKAEMVDTIVNIITPEDLKSRNVTTKKDINTWQFEAQNVTDFAFGTSDHYVWKSVSVMVDSVTKRRTRVDAVFNPIHRSYIPVVDYARKTVELISNYFPKVSFPYAHETVFDGLDAMEYPMMVNNRPIDDHRENIELTAHEVFHSLFPFYVGSNETKYSFMDEGLATLTEFYFYPKIDPLVPVNYDITYMNNSAVSAEDVPIMTLTPQLYSIARFTDKDLKPALALYYLKEMLGEPLFIKAIQKYIHNWHGKHPTPYDFFNSLNAGSGKNLNWFWKNWFFEKNDPDLAITKVIERKSDYEITITSLGTLAVPIHLTITYQDGSIQKVERDLSCWQKKNKTVVFHISNKKHINKLTIGNELDVDIDLSNNKWDAK